MAAGWGSIASTSGRGYCFLEAGSVLLAVYVLMRGSVLLAVSLSVAVI